MFHKIKSVYALPDYKLSVEFSERITKIYDVKPLFKKIPLFAELERQSELFSSVSVDVGGCGIVWNDELDLSCEELWENGNAEKALIEELKIGEKSGDSLQMYMGDAYSVPVNIAGVPSLSLPCGKGEGGMPVGMQLTGPAFSEALLYRAGYAFENQGK